MLLVLLSLSLFLFPFAPPPFFLLLSHLSMYVPVDIGWMRMRAVCCSRSSSRSSSCFSSYSLARHRLYESFASRESLNWGMFTQTATPSRWRSSRYEALRTWWVAEGGVFDILMFLGPTPQDVHRQYHIATGKFFLKKEFQSLFTPYCYYA